MDRRVSQYISKKSDASSRPATQNLVNGKWVTIEAGGITKLVPTETSKTGALWATYLNITTPKLGGATQLTIKWVRDAAGINDATGYQTFTLNKGGTTYVKDLWLFQAKKGQPVTLQVKANGKATVTTRELKLSIS
jgi:hypothetical protein